MIISPRMASVRRKLQSFRGKPQNPPTNVIRRAETIQEHHHGAGLEQNQEVSDGYDSSDGRQHEVEPTYHGAEEQRRASIEDAVDLPGNFGQAYSRVLGPRLDVIERIRPLLNDQGISLPSIVVIGDQSSGKTSVIERLAGVELPRGNGIVTRCPLIIRLVRDEEAYEPFATVQYTPHGGTDSVQMEIAIEQVSEAIEAATYRLAGDNKSIVNSPIYLRVISARVPDLTLIDLPGITRNPVGDQPEDIEQRIKAMIHEYIKPEESVILCVLPANVDFSTCEGLKLGRRVDPKGKRMLGVVTKLDLAPKGIKEKLEAKGAEHVKLEMGFIAVRNRDSTEAREAELSTEEVSLLEKEYFRHHPELSNLSSRYLGTDELVRRLVQIQLGRVQEAVPRIKEKVAQSLQKTKQTLRELRPKCASEREAQILFASRSSELQQMFSALKDARYDVLGEQSDLPSLHVPARLYELFKAFHERIRATVPQFLYSEYTKTIEERIDEARGCSLDNFMSHPVFQRCYKDCVASQLSMPSQQLVTQVKEYIESVLHELCGIVFPDLDRLDTTVREFVTELCFVIEERVKSVTEDLVRQEERIFTMNHGYMLRINAVKSAVDSLKLRPEFQEQAGACDPKDLEDLVTLPIGDGLVPKEFIVRFALASAAEERDRMELQLSLAVYGDIVLQNIGDTVPKSVMLHFVSNLSRDLVRHLQRMILEKGPLLELTKDSPAVIERREAEEEKLHRLEAAWKQLRTI